MKKYNLKVMEILEENDIKLKYIKALDYISDYMFNEYKISEKCDFKNNKCIANRLGKSSRNCNGCCYKRKEGLCSYLKDNGCSIDCVSCKLFVCEYLERKYGKVKINDILPINKIFNRKQREIIKRSFFRDKEKIVELLLDAK